MKAVADTLGVARSNLAEQLHCPERPRRGPYAHPEDKMVISQIRAITDERPTYGYRRVTALLNRARRSSGQPRLNHKRVFRLMRMASLLLQPCTGRRNIRAHEGRVIADASNLRWASDGFEIPAGMARWFASHSPSTPMTGRLWHWSQPRTAASAVR